MARKPSVKQIVRDLDPSAAEVAVDEALDALAESDLATGDPKRKEAIEKLAKEPMPEPRSRKRRNTH